MEGVGMVVVEMLTNILTLIVMGGGGSLRHTDLPIRDCTFFSLAIIV